MILKFHFKLSNTVAFITHCLISEKLLDFNRKLADGVHKVDESHLENVVKLAEAGATANPLQIQVLKQLLEWPKGRCEIYLLACGNVVQL
jgi:glutamate racemase